MGVKYTETAGLTSTSNRLRWADHYEDLTVPSQVVIQYDENYNTFEFIQPAYITPVLIPGVVNKYASLWDIGNLSLYELQNVSNAMMDSLRKDLGDSTVSIGDDGYLYRHDATEVPTLTTTITTTGGTRILTSKAVEGFNLVLSCPGLYKINKQTGYEATQVQVNIYYRPFTTNAAAPWTILQQEYTISGNQRAEILKTVGTGTAKLPLAKYELLIVRVTEDHTGNASYMDDVYVKEIVEIVFGTIGYNHTALLGLKIRATDQLSGQVPTVTSLVKGIKVQVPSNLAAAYALRYDSNWDNNYDTTNVISQAYTTGWLDGALSPTRVWTDNPVWCLYDLLTNTRYGLGNYYKISEHKRGLMLANFYLMGKYCDEKIMYTDEHGEVRYRPRFALNIVIDQSKSAAEWIGQISAIMRAVVYYSEGLFWIDIDRPKPPTQIFNMSNITEYTQAGIPFRGMPNSYEVQWVNPAINYEIDSFKMESTELQQNPHLEERKKALQLIGVTNFDQAKSVAQYALLSGIHKDKVVTFKTGTDGLRSAVSDVIAIQHDVPKWGYGGSITTYNKETGVATLEPPIVPTYADGIYELKVDLGDGSEFVTIYLGTLTEPVASVQLGAGRELSATPSLKAVLGIATNDLHTFKIVAIKRDADEKVEITAVVHDDRLFDSCDDTTGVTTYTTRDYSLLENPQRVSVQGVSASAKLYQDSIGVWRTGVEVFFDPPKMSTFWKGAQLHYSLVGAGVYTSLPDLYTYGYIFLPYLPDGEYQLVLTSVYTVGKQTISDALNDADKRPWTVTTISSYAPNDIFLEGVRGLSIENMANDGTFYGRDCIVVWKKPSVIDVDDSAGVETNGAATANTDMWFGYYVVQVFSASAVAGLPGEVVYEPGGLRRTNHIYDEKYVYTYENNYQDSVSTDEDADRRFFVAVTIIDKLGRRSATSYVLCQNPAPTKIQ